MDKGIIELFCVHELVQLTVDSNLFVAYDKIN